MAKYPGVSRSVTRRLPRYYRFLDDLKQKNIERISSREFAEITGLTASQIRQDLNCFGGFGQQGYGYNVATLHAEIGRILTLDRARPTVLIGAGNLGSAVARHMKFDKRGFSLDAIFDNNPDIIGRTIRGLVVQDVKLLKDFCTENPPQVAILCIPREATSETARLLIDCGVRGFWNFSHYDLSVEYGDKIAVENVHLGDSLMTLSFHVSELIEGNDGANTNPC